MSFAAGNFTRPGIERYVDPKKRKVKMDYENISEIQYKVADMKSQGKERRKLKLTDIE
jgi:hypothetical protein